MPARVPATHAHAQPPVAQPGLLTGGVEQAECLVGGAEQRGLLDHSARWRRAERVGFVPCDRRAPARCSHSCRATTSCGTGPSASTAHRGTSSAVRAELAAPVVGVLGSPQEPRAVVLRRVARDKVDRGCDVRREPTGEPVRDPLVDHLGERAASKPRAGTASARTTSGSRPASSAVRSSRSSTRWCRRRPASPAPAGRAGWRRPAGPARPTCELSGDVDRIVLRPPDRGGSHARDREERPEQRQPDSQDDEDREPDDDQRAA